MKPPGAPVLASGVAHILAWGLTLWLATWPGLYQGVSATSVSVATREPDPQSTGSLPLDTAAISTPPADGRESVRVSASLIQVNGFWVLGLLAIPLVLTGLGLISATMRRTGRAAGSRYPWRLVGWVAALVLLGFCIVASFSVGLLYLPVTLLTLASVALRSRPKAEGASSPE